MTQAFLVAGCLLSSYGRAAREVEHEQEYPACSQWGRERQLLKKGHGAVEAFPSHVTQRLAPGRALDGVIFPTLIDIVAETAIVSFHTLLVGFPLTTISKNSLSTLFCPLILDHGVLLKISISGPQNSCFVNLARYFFSP